MHSIRKGYAVLRPAARETAGWGEAVIKEATKRDVLLFVCFGPLRGARPLLLKV